MVHLQLVDYLVFVAFLLISLGIGLYYALSGGKQRTIGEFLLADRQLGVIPTTLSILVSFQSAIAVLGVPAEMYTRGTQMWIWNCVGFAAGVVMTERLVVNIFFPLQLTSIYDYLELRFHSRAVRYVGTLLGLTQQVFYMGVAMFAPSVAMESVSGFPVWCSIIIMAVVATCYTTLGGLKAVVWTDVFQFCVMFMGLMAILIKGTVVVGGVERVWKLNDIGGRIELVSFDPRPTTRHTVWNLVIGGAFYWFGFYGCNQASVQRFTATKSVGAARKVLLINIPIVVVMSFIVSFLGLIVYAYFSVIQCDPLENGDIRNPNQLLPFFVMKVMGDIPGLPGLFMATLYSGALSSVSSSLSASDANTWDDILRRKFGHVTEYRASLITRFLVICYGVLATIVALIVMSYPGPMTQLGISVLGAVTGPLVAIFLLGTLTNWINWKGIVSGAISGLIIIVWIIMGSFTVDQNILNPPMPPLPTDGCHHLNGSSYLRDAANNNVTTVYESENMDMYSANESRTINGISNLYCISYMLYCVVGMMGTFIIAIPVSLLTRTDTGLQSQEMLHVDLYESFCCCFDRSKKPTKPENEVENQAAPM